MLHITKEMFEMNAPRPIAQGEVSIWIFEEGMCPPEIYEAAQKCEFEVMSLEKDRLIVGHSETGHHHVIEPVSSAVPVSQAAQAMIDKTNDLFITLKLHHDCGVNHLRGSDTHGSYMLSGGLSYIIRPDDEQTVEGWQRVAD